jgi:hypothetical protein
MQTMQNFLLWERPMNGAWGDQHPDCRWSIGGDFIALRLNGERMLRKLVPAVGIELTTYRLQGGCSTTELSRRNIYST